MKAKEFIPAGKPRNFVAKNQQTAGAGAHKDKKRAEKHGNVKHKKQAVPVESVTEISDKALQRYKQDAHTEIQGAKFGQGKGKPESEKIIAKREKGMSAANKRLSTRDAERRANYKRPEPAKTSSGPQDWYGQNRYMGDSIEQGSTEDGAISEDGIRPKLAASLTELGFKGPFKLGQLPKWMAELQDGRFDKDTSIMIGGDDPNYDPWVAKGYDYGYAYGMESGYQTGLSAQEVFKQAKDDMGSQGVAEVSKATIDRYVAKASDAHGDADFAARMSKNDPDKRSYHVDQKKTAEKRRQGISRALDRMSKNEDVAETRQSAAVKLAKAWDQQKAKSTASRERAKELLNPAKKDQEKKNG
jgi:hypothetical protein